jgi:hypothetical protein
MAITLGVGPVAAAYSGTAITLALNGTTAGRSLVVGFIYLSSATVVNVACDGGESDLTLHGATANATSGVSAQMASLGEIATGGNKTVTVNFSADPGFALAFVLEAAGGDIASFFDVGAGASGNDATPTVNVTTSADNALVVAIAHNLGGVPTAGGAYVSVTVGTQTVGEYDLDAGAAGSKTVDFSSVSNQWVVRAAAFNAAPPSAAITVSGGGAITPAGEKGALGSVAVTGDGSVVVVGPPHVTGTAAVSGSGSVAVLGVLGWTTVAAVTGDGSIVVAGFQSYFWQDTGALPMWSEDSAYESQGVFIESALLPAGCSLNPRRCRHGLKLAPSERSRLSRRRYCPCGSRTAGSRRKLPRFSADGRKT